MTTTNVRNAENQKEFTVAAACSTLFRRALSTIFRNPDNKVLGLLLSFFLNTGHVHKKRFAQKY